MRLKFVLLASRLRFIRLDIHFYECYIYTSVKTFKGGVKMVKVEDVFNKVFEFGRIYLANAFSLNMLKKEESKLEVYRLSYEDAKKLLVDCMNYGVQMYSIVGHSSTAEIFNELFHPIYIEPNRENLEIEKGALFVIQVGVRLTEGYVLNKEELEQFLKEGKIKFFVVLVY